VDPLTPKCSQAIKDLKDSEYKYLILLELGNKVHLDKTGSPGASIDDLIRDLPTSDYRYIIWRGRYEAGFIDWAPRDVEHRYRHYTRDVGREVFYEEGYSGPTINQRDPESADEERSLRAAIAKIDKYPYLD
jgi:hypothetical protein